MTKTHVDTVRSAEIIARLAQGEPLATVASDLRLSSAQRGAVRRFVRALAVAAE